MHKRCVGRYHISIVRWTAASSNKLYWTVYCQLDLWLNWEVQLEDSRKKKSRLKPIKLEIISFHNTNPALSIEQVEIQILLFFLNLNWILNSSYFVDLFEQTRSPHSLTVCVCVFKRVFRQTEKMKFMKSQV